MTNWDTGKDPDLQEANMWVGLISAMITSRFNNCECDQATEEDVGTMYVDNQFIRILINDQCRCGVIEIECSVTGTCESTFKRIRVNKRLCDPSCDAVSIMEKLEEYINEQIRLRDREPNNISTGERAL
jgi:hypothetical protein